MSDEPKQRYWHIEVHETVASRRVYIVEADDADEARAKAEDGDTFREETIREEGVVNRTVAWPDEVGEITEAEAQAHRTEVERPFGAAKVRPLVKTTMVIWSEAPETEWDIARLAQEATNGEAYCSHSESVLVENPVADPEWDGTEFFGVLDEDETKGKDATP